MKFFLDALLVLILFISLATIVNSLESGRLQPKINCIAKLKKKLKNGNDVVIFWGYNLSRPDTGLDNFYDFQEVIKYGGPNNMVKLNKQKLNNSRNTFPIKFLIGDHLNQFITTSKINIDDDTKIDDKFTYSLGGKKISSQMYLSRNNGGIINQYISRCLKPSQTLKCNKKSECKIVSSISLFIEGNSYDTFKLGKRKTPIDFYSYNKPLKESSNTPLGFERKYKNRLKDNMWIVPLESRGELYLMVAVDVPLDGSGGKAKLKIQCSKNNLILASKNKVKELSNNTTQVKLKWKDCNNDGFIIGPIDSCFMLDTHTQSTLHVHDNLLIKLIHSRNSKSKIKDITNNLSRYNSLGNIKICPSMYKPKCKKKKKKKKKDGCKKYNKCGGCANEKCNWGMLINSNIPKVISKYDNTCNIKYIEKDKKGDRVRLTINTFIKDGLTNVTYPIVCSGKKKLSKKLNENWLVEKKISMNGFQKIKLTNLMKIKDFRRCFKVKRNKDKIDGKIEIESYFNQTYIDELFNGTNTNNDNVTSIFFKFPCKFSLKNHNNKDDNTRIISTQTNVDFDAQFTLDLNIIRNQWLRRNGKSVFHTLLVTRIMRRVDGRDYILKNPKIRFTGNNNGRRSALMEEDKDKIFFEKTKRSETCIHTSIDYKMCIQSWSIILDPKDRKTQCFSKNTRVTFDLIESETDGSDSKLKKKFISGVVFKRICKPLIKKDTVPDTGEDFKVISRGPFHNKELKSKVAKVIPNERIYYSLNIKRLTKDLRVTDKWDWCKNKKLVVDYITVCYTKDGYNMLNANCALLNFTDVSVAWDKRGNKNFEGGIWETRQIYSPHKKCHMKKLIISFIPRAFKLNQMRRNFMVSFKYQIIDSIGLHHLSSPDKKNEAHTLSGKHFNTLWDSYDITNINSNGVVVTRTVSANTNIGCYNGLVFYEANDIFTPGVCANSPLFYAFSNVNSQQFIPIWIIFVLLLGFCLCFCCLPTYSYISGKNLRNTNMWFKPVTCNDDCHIEHVKNGEYRRCPNRDRDPRCAVTFVVKNDIENQSKKFCDNCLNNTEVDNSRPYSDEEKGQAIQQTENAFDGGSIVRRYNRG